MKERPILPGTRIHHQFRPLAEIEVAVFHPMTVILVAVSKLVESGLPLHVRTLVVMLPKPVYRAWSSNLKHVSAAPLFNLSSFGLGLEIKVRPSQTDQVLCFREDGSFGEMVVDVFGPRPEIMGLGR